MKLRQQRDSNYIAAFVLFNQNNNIYQLTESLRLLVAERSEST